MKNRLLTEKHGVVLYLWKMPKTTWPYLNAAAASLAGWKVENINLTKVKYVLGLRRQGLVICPQHPEFALDPCSKRPEGTINAAFQPCPSHAQDIARLWMVQRLPAENSTAIERLRFMTCPVPSRLEAPPLASLSSKQETSVDWRA